MSQASVALGDVSVLSGRPVSLGRGRKAGEDPLQDRSLETVVAWAIAWRQRWWEALGSGVFFLRSVTSICQVERGNLVSGEPLLTLVSRD